MGKKSLNHHLFDIKEQRQKNNKKRITNVLSLYLFGSMISKTLFILFDINFFFVRPCSFFYVFCVYFLILYHLTFYKSYRFCYFVSLYKFNILSVTIIQLENPYCIAPKPIISNRRFFLEIYFIFIERIFLFHLASQFRSFPFVSLKVME